MEIITTHINAEFDSFTSMVAARRLYPEALMVFPGAQERNLRLFLEGYPHQYGEPDTTGIRRKARAARPVGSLRRCA